MKKVIITILICAISVIGTNAQSIDSTFNTNGYLPYGGSLSNSSQNAYGGNNMVMQPDGKLVVAEDYTNGNVNNDLFFYTYRYDENGLPDASFGTNGVSAIYCGGQSDNRDLQLQPDGKIVVVGATEYCTLGVCGALQFIMMRLKTNGDLDSTFGNNGKLRTMDIFGGSGLFALPNTFKILPDGKFIVGGKGPGYLAFVARLKSNGFPDSTFGTNGVYLDPSGAIFKDLAINNDGDILVLLEKYNYVQGVGSDTTNLFDNYIFKLKATGVIDNTFGNAGVLVFSGSNSEHPRSIAIKNDQSIVVVGDEQFNNTENNNWNGTGSNGFAITNKGYVAFVNANGTMASYIPGGYKSIEIPTDTATLFQKIIVLNDNRLFISGKVVTASTNYREKALLCQIDSLGNFINDFNTNGYWVFDNGVSTGAWQRTLCAFNDIDVTSNDEVYATGYRNYTPGGPLSSLFLLKLKDVITGSVPLNIPTVSNNPSFLLYPNPVQDVLTIESDAKTTYTIFNIEGKVIYTGSLIKGVNNIHLSTSLGSGVYFIRDSRTSQVTKFIKK
jgi:uncharacterized delta-60 repeat protein